MAAVTPNRSNSSHSSTYNADYTRLQEPQSPTNLNRTTKRQQRLNINTPPRLNLGNSTCNYNTAAKAISSQLEVFEHEAYIQRTVIHEFAATVDQFMSAYTNEEQQFV
jgi:hypothetical protein